MGVCSSQKKTQEKILADYIHDIRGLLTPLFTSVQLLELSDLSIEQKKHVLTIKTSVEKITDKLTITHDIRNSTV